MSLNMPSSWIAKLRYATNLPALGAKESGRTVFLLLAALLSFGIVPATAQTREQVNPVFEHALPNAQGKRMVAVVVNYAPGAKSAAHHHAASAFIYAYVLSGAIRSQVGNEPVKVYHAGEGFFEMPGSQHRVSENASNQEPARLLAVFVVDSEDKALTTPDR